MSSTEQVRSGGISLGGLLFIVFVVAKLWDKVDWSWFWVCSPLWIPFGIWAAVVAVTLLFAAAGFAVAVMIEKFQRIRNR